MRRTPKILFLYLLSVWEALELVFFLFTTFYALTSHLYS